MTTCRSFPSKQDESQIYQIFWTERVQGGIPDFVVLLCLFSFVFVEMESATSEFILMRIAVRQALQIKLFDRFHSIFSKQNKKNESGLNFYLVLFFFFFFCSITTNNISSTLSYFFMFFHIP